jgi:adenylosuccinate synthase
VPIYEEIAGWTDDTVGAQSVDLLPATAKAYIKRVEELTGVPVDIVSTGPDRAHTVILRNPYSV